MSCEGIRRQMAFIILILCNCCSVQWSAYSVGRFLKLLLSSIAWPSPTCCSIRARTLRGSPKRVMKPWASLWLYSSPVVKEAMLSLYRLYFDQEPAPRIEPLYNLSFTQPVQVFCVTSINALHASISGVNHFPS